MTTITFDTTHIALDRARAFERHRGARSVAAIEWIATHGSRLAIQTIAFCGRPIRNIVANAIERDTKQVLELGALLDGVGVRIAGSTKTEYIDSESELIAALDKLCGGLQKTIKDASAAAAGLGRLFPQARLIGIIQKNVDAYRSTLLSVTNLKWEIMEQDADVAILNGDISAFMSADDLIAQLQR